MDDVILQRRDDQWLRVGVWGEGTYAMHVLRALEKLLHVEFDVTGLEFDTFVLEKTSDITRWRLPAMDQYGFRMQVRAALFTVSITTLQ